MTKWKSKIKSEIFSDNKITKKLKKYLLENASPSSFIDSIIISRTALIQSLIQFLIQFLTVYPCLSRIALINHSINCQNLLSLRITTHHPHPSHCIYSPSQVLSPVSISIISHRHKIRINPLCHEKTYNVFCCRLTFLGRKKLVVTGTHDTNSRNESTCEDWHAERSSTSVILTGACTLRCCPIFLSNYITKMNLKVGRVSGAALSVFPGTNMTYKVELLVHMKLVAKLVIKLVGSSFRMTLQVLLLVLLVLTLQALLVWSKPLAHKAELWMCHNITTGDSKSEVITLITTGHITEYVHMNVCLALAVALRAVAARANGTPAWQAWWEGQMKAGCTALGGRRAGLISLVPQKFWTHPWVRLRSSAAQAASWGEQVRDLQIPTSDQRNLRRFRRSHGRWRLGRRCHPRRLPLDEKDHGVVAPRWPPLSILKKGQVRYYALKSSHEVRENACDQKSPHNLNNSNKSEVLDNQNDQNNQNNHNIVIVDTKTPQPGTFLHAVLTPSNLVIRRGIPITKNGEEGEKRDNGPYK